MTLEIEMGWDCGEGLRVYLMRGLIEDCHFLLPTFLHRLCHQYIICD
jgi:hypothetical protein